MTTRLLATIEGVFCAVPLRDHLSNLITTTQYLVDRNIYAAVLTRQQWDKLREEYWATGRQCDHGRLVPDMDFVASDGKSFLDFEECRKHEAAIAAAEFLKTKPCHACPPDFAERSEFIAAGICADVVQYNNGEFCNAATEHRFQDWLWQKSQCGQKVKSSGSYPEEAGSIPATATISDTTSLEDRMFVVVGSNYMSLSLVASLLKTDENAVRAVAESSGKFKLSGTGKSIAKT